MTSKASELEGWVAALATLTGATMSPLLGCGGLASDGDHSADLVTDDALDRISWFVFGEQDAHPDHCRWRAHSWHGSGVTAPSSHSNYHLGFRCCKDL